MRANNSRNSSSRSGHGESSGNRLVLAGIDTSRQIINDSIRQNATPDHALTVQVERQELKIPNDVEQFLSIRFYDGRLVLAQRLGFLAQ